MMNLVTRHGKSPVIIAVLLLGLSVTVAEANVRFFVQVMRNLQHYRVTGDQVAFDLEGAGTGNLIFNLTLPSRRNNYEEVLMAGYLSAAYAIDRTGLRVKRVNVNAVIVSDQGRIIATTTSATNLAKLVSKELTPHQFLGIIEKIN